MLKSYACHGHRLSFGTKKFELIHGGRDGLGLNDEGERKKIEKEKGRKKRSQREKKKEKIKYIFNERRERV